MEREVLNFITKFKNIHPKALEDAFLYGNCYWFAHILNTRFGGRIVYLPVDNHFILQYHNKFYDITGEVEVNQVWYYWDDYRQIEPTHSKRIIRDCIEKR
jgi:hypothetical protein